MEFRDLKMNRRQVVCSIAKVAVLPIVGLGSLNALAGVTKIPDLIRVEWLTTHRKYHTNVFGSVYIHDKRIAGYAWGWPDGNLEAMDHVLTFISNMLKHEVYRELKTHEYDPVIDNSTTQFYQ